MGAWGGQFGTVKKIEMSASEREKIKSLKTGTMQSYVVFEAIEGRGGYH